MGTSRRYGPASLRTRWAAVLTLGLSIAMALTACGSSSSSGGGTASPSAASADSPGSPASLVPADIKSRGSITFVTDATVEPFGVLQGTKLTGIDVETMKALAPLLGIKISVVNQSVSTFVPALQSDRYDGALSSLGDTPERRQVLDFIDYIHSGLGFVLPASSSTPISGLTSLCGLRVAVETGAKAATVAATQKQACATAGLKDLTVVAFPNQSEAALSLTSGRADVLIGPVTSIGYVAKQSDGSLRLVNLTVMPQYAGMGLLKGSALEPAILAGMTELYNNGTLKKIFTKYGLGQFVVKPGLNQQTS